MMPNVHCYFAVENLNLNASQRQTMAAGLRQLGPKSHRQPACLCHWRKRLDSEACIFEALFDEDDLTIVAFKGHLANLFSVDPKDIGHALAQESFAGGTTPIVTFSYNATDYLRMLLFGGTDTAWMESGDECRGYLKANISEWE